MKTSKYLELIRALEDDGIKYLVVGSYPILYLVDRRYRHKIEGNEGGKDIDLVVGDVATICPYVSRVWEQDHIEIVKGPLIRRVKITSEGYEIERYPTEVCELDGYKNGKRTILPISVFENRVGIIKVNLDDPLVISTDNNQKLRMPRLGTYLATCLHPWALQEGRITRTGHVIQFPSFDYGDIKEIGRVSREALREGILNFRYHLRGKDVERARNRIMNVINRNNWDLFREYLEVAYDLGYLLQGIS